MSERSLIDCYESATGTSVRRIQTGYYRSSFDVTLPAYAAPQVVTVMNTNAKEFLLLLGSCNQARRYESCGC